MPYKSKKRRNAYMRAYMKELRKIERQIIRDARLAGLNTRVRKTQKKPKRRKKR